MADNNVQAADETDALLEQIYAPEKPIQEQETPAPETTVQKYRIKVQGKEEELPVDELISLAQKGRDYEINNRLLRQERELLDIRKKEIDSFNIEPDRLKELKQLDDYARENPKFLDLVKENWTKLQSGDLQQSEANQAAPVWDKLNTLESRLNEIISEKTKMKEAQDDQALDNELKSLREKYKDFPWNDKDEFGYTREHKLLQHLSNGGFHSAKAAFMDMYGEEILEKTIQKTKEQITNEIQSRNKKGLIVHDRLHSKSAVQPRRDLRSVTYDDLLVDALKDIDTGG